MTKFLIPITLLLLTGCMTDAKRDAHNSAIWDQKAQLRTPESVQMLKPVIKACIDYLLFETEPPLTAGHLVGASLRKGLFGNACTIHVSDNGPDVVFSKGLITEIVEGYGFSEKKQHKRDKKALVFETETQELVFLATSFSGVPRTDLHVRLFQN